MGPAGKQQAWHHIVEQTPAYLSRFGPEAIHTLGNIVPLPHGAGSVHARISGFYSSKSPSVTGSVNVTVREWLSTKSFDDQFNFGVMVISLARQGAL